MEQPVATTSTEYSESCEAQKSVSEQENLKIKKDYGGIFKCSFCKLEEHYDYKGAKPPFARAIAYLEDCYIMKDPFSLPNKGEVLVLGADCSFCNKQVCLGCSLFFVKRFCQLCGIKNMSRLPVQLHAKIKNLNKDGSQSDVK